MKTKQIISLALISLIAILSLTSCFGSSDLKKSVENALNNEKVTTEQTTTLENSDDKDVDVDVDSGSGSTNWKTFLKEYEEWVDEYIAITKKYKANPSDYSVLSEYTELAQKASEWSVKADDITKELKNASAAELEEYDKELSRISDKLNSVDNE